MKTSRLLIALGGTALLLAAASIWGLHAEDPRSPEAIAADGLCRAPLHAYCRESCPSYAKMLENAQRHERSLFADAGTCGSLKWIGWSSGFDGETAYFGAEDELVAVEAWKDYAAFCTAKSTKITYGERSECQRITTVTLKARTSESSAGAP